MSKNCLSSMYGMRIVAGGNSIRTLHENHPEISLTLVSGGLFVGERSLPIKDYPPFQKQISVLVS